MDDLSAALVVASPRLVASILTVAAGAWLAHLDRTSRPARAFALLLVIHGLWNGLDILDGMFGRSYGPLPAVQGVYFATAILLLAVELAALWFVAVMLAPGGWLADRRRGGVLMLATLGLFVAGIAVEPRLYLAFATDANGHARVANGAFMALTSTPSFAFFSLLLARAWARAPDGPERRTLLLVALGLVIGGARNTGRSVVDALTGDGASTLADAPVVQALRAVYPWVSLAIFAALVTVLLPAALRGAPAERRDGRILLGVAAVGIGIGTLQALGDPRALVVSAGNSLVSLAYPAAVVYGLLRGRIFGLDTKVRLGVKASTVGFVFLAIFVLAAQVAEQFFSTKLGWAFGGLAAGAMLLAIQPIQRVAERVANAAVPAEPRKLAGEDRLAAYRAQLAAAYADGGVDRSERRMLDAAREGLGLTPEEATRVESEFVRGA